MARVILAVTMLLFFAGCSPEIGSEKWCANLKQRPSGEWTQNETKEYFKNCILKFGEKNDE